jgi:hypothetical protein
MVELTLGRGANWRISSWMAEPCLSQRDCMTERRDLASRVSSKRGMESGLPVKFGRALLMVRGVVLVGKRALAMAGEVDMGSSSGDGEREAFLFRDDDGLDTVKMSVSAGALVYHDTAGGRPDHAGSKQQVDSSEKWFRPSDSLVLLGEKRLSWKRCGGTGGVAASRLFMMARRSM